MMTTEISSTGQQKGKLAYLLKIASIVIAATAITWTTFYIVTQNWLAALGESTFIMLGYLAYTAASRNNTKTIAQVYFPLLLVMMCIFCLFLDVPNAIVPRSAHHYFLPMLLYAYIIYQDENPYLKVTTLALISIAFLVFSCTSIGVNLSSMTNEHRLIGVWLTNAEALVMLALVALVMQSEFKIRHTLELELSKALLKNELHFYFQPQVNKNGVVLGAEILTRWNHPSLGNIPPDVFIPLAEESDLILYLGKQVLATACNQLAIWKQNKATEHLTLSVNISVKQFQSAEFTQYVIALLDDTKIDAHKLKLEVTESIFAVDLDVILTKMMQLKSYGIQFSLDDFGTGYSSLAYVKNMPLDELKIDKSFIKDVLTNVSDASITKMIISLARELNIAIIAEGVEKKEQQQFLIENGCHHYQGYFYSPPLPINEFDAFVLANQYQKSTLSDDAHYAAVSAAL